MSLIEPDPYDVWQLWKRLWEERHGDIVSDEYRAMMIRHGKSGFPADVFVNTFYFLADSNKVTAADDISAALHDFIDGNNTTWAIGKYYSHFVTDVCTIKVYKMSDPHSPGPPKVQREPLVREFNVSQTPSTDATLPDEIAVCLSFSAASPHTARRRGRVYIGPLNIDTTTQATGTNFTQVAPQFMTDLCVAAARLSSHPDAGWLIAHDANGSPSYAAVETGWVDNAYDVQRRRGEKATTRQTWAKPA